MANRIDKWLWAIRAYKSRTEATKKCQSGKVKVDGTKMKPSSEVKEGILITFEKNKIFYTYEVVKCLQKRVGSAIAKEAYIDKTPIEELQKKEEMLQENFLLPQFFRKRGTGRPTKKERRNIDDITGQV